MSDKEVAIIRGTSIMSGDIVKIKFRKLEDILNDERKFCRAGDAIDHYQIQDHLTALSQGVGHFKVKNIERSLKLSQNRRIKVGQPTDPRCNLPEIIITDHNNSDYDWTINEILIEEITIENDIAESYFSETHQLSLLVINSVLFINGRAVTSTDSKIFEMFEKVLSDVAIKRILETDDNEEFEDDDLKEEED